MSFLERSKTTCETCSSSVCGCLTHDGLLELGGLVNIEELACTQRKDHALIVFLQLIVDLGRDQCCQLSLRKRVIFVQSLTMTHMD